MNRIRNVLCKRAGSGHCQYTGQMHCHVMKLEKHIRTDMKTKLYTLNSAY